ncbi:hypothetical protein Pmar_PMAR005580, partial [Perkinsus marinus ATCC 50983]
AYESTTTALRKWTRTIVHYLRKGHADGAMRKRIAEKLTALNDQIPDGSFECIPPEPAWRDMLVATVKQ